MNASYLIVVGVDGSEGGHRALEWAAAAAATRGGAVQAVIAWSWDGTTFGPLIATNPQEAAQRSSQLLDRQIQTHIDRRGSHLPIAGQVIEGRPADVLTRAARSANLLVLGSHKIVNHRGLGRPVGGW